MEKELREELADVRSQLAEEQRLREAAESPASQISTQRVAPAMATLAVHRADPVNSGWFRLSNEERRAIRQARREVVLRQRKAWQTPGPGHHTVFRKGRVDSQHARHRYSAGPAFTMTWPSRHGSIFQELAMVPGPG